MIPGVTQCESDRDIYLLKHCVHSQWIRHCTFKVGGGVSPTLCILPGVWLVRSLSLLPLPVLLLPAASLRRHTGRHECSFLPSFLALSLTNEGHWNLQKMEHDNLYSGDMVSRRVWASHLVGLQIYAASPVPPLDKLAFFFPSRLSKCILHFYQWNHWPSNHASFVFWSCLCFWLGCYWNIIATW